MQFQSQLNIFLHFILFNFEKCQVGKNGKYTTHWLSLEKVVSLSFSLLLSRSFKLLFSSFRWTFSLMVFFTILFHLFSHWDKLVLSSAISSFILSCCERMLCSYYTDIVTIFFFSTSINIEFRLFITFNVRLI